MPEYKNFTWREITMGRSVPDYLIENIYPTMEILQKIRDYLGLKIIIVSSYRSPEYNKKVGGAKNSLHMQFKAIDFKVSGYKSMDYVKLAYLIRSGKFGPVGGVGLYKRFIHIDCGARRDW